MKKVTTRPSFQGDLMIRRIDAVPAGLKAAVAERGVHILAHSKTGHHHVIESWAADRFIDEANAFIAYLEVMEPTELKHLRDHDTHETLVLDPGAHEVRNQREYAPEGWRRAAD
jgi:hypothetical protein